MTTVARSLLDLAPRLSLAQLKKLLSEADRKGLASRVELRRVLNRGSGWRGIGRLRDAVDEWDPLVAMTKSDLEVLFVAARKRYRIPQPEINVEIGMFVVDCFWREQKTIVELDTYTFHGDQLSFERDHSRDLILEGMGFRVLRITGRMLRNNEQGVMRTLEGLLYR